MPGLSQQMTFREFQPAVIGTYLLKGTLILNALGSNKHPAVSKGQLLYRCAPKLLKQSSRLVVHSTNEKIITPLGEQFVNRTLKQIFYIQEDSSIGSFVTWTRN